MDWLNEPKSIDNNSSTYGACIILIPCPTESSGGCRSYGPVIPCGTLAQTGNCGYN